MAFTVKELVVEMKSDVAGLKKGFDEYKKQSSAAQEKTNKFNKSVNQLKGNLAKLGITVGAAAIFKGIITSTIEFEDHIANLNTLLKDQPGYIDGLEQGFLDLAGPLGSASELAEAAYDAISGGVEPGQAVEFIGKAAQFAKANLIELKDATDLLTTIMNTYGASAGNVAEITDTLTTVVRLGKTHGDELAATFGDIAGTAKTVGISFDDLAVSLIATTAGGINTSKSMTALKATISNIARPSKEAREIAKELGIQFNLAGIKAKGWTGFLKHLTEKVKDNTDAQIKLFGSVEAFNAVAVLTSEEGLKKMAAGQEALEKKTGATEEAYEKQQKTFSAVLESLKNEFEAAFIKVILPALKDFAAIVKENRDEIIGFFNALITAGKELSAINLAKVLDIAFKAPKIMAGGGLNPYIAGIRNMKAELDMLNPVFEYFKDLGEAAISPFTGLTDALNKSKESIDDLGKKTESTTKKIIPFAEVLEDLQEKAKDGTIKIKDLTITYDKYYPEIVESTKKTKAFVDVLDILREDAAPKTIIQLEAIRAVLTESKKPTDEWIKEIENGIIPLEDFADEISYTADMSKELHDETIKMTDVMGDMPNTIAGVRDRMKELAEKYERGEITQGQFEGGMFLLKQRLEELENQFKFVTDGIQAFGDVMRLILPSMDDFIGNITGMFTGLSSLETAFSDISKIDWSTAFSAGISILTSIASVIGTTDWEKYGTHMGTVLGLSDDMTKRLASLSAEMEGVNGALYTLMDEIINDENIDNFEDFNKWLKEIAGMLPAVAGGATPIRELEEAFTALIANADDIGYLGRAFHSVIGNAQELGLELQSITDFMENEMIQGADGYRAAIEANFTDAIIPTFDDFIEYQDKIADNKALVDGVEGWGRAIISFGNINEKVLQTDMNSFIQGTLDGYDDLIEKGGFDVPQALALIAPQLGTLIALAEDHGLVLDDNIQSLIDLADENNISVERRKTAEEELIEVLRELIEVINGELGPGIEDFANNVVAQFENVKGSIYDAKGELVDFVDSIPGNVGIGVTADIGHIGGAGIGEIPGFQAGTHGVFVPTPREFIVHGNEHIEMRGNQMRVTPLSNNVLGGGDGGGNILNLNVTIKAIDGKDAYEVMRDTFAPWIYEFSKKGVVTIDNKAIIKR